MPLYRREGSPFWQYDFTVAGARFRGSTGETVKGRAREVEADQRHLAKNAQRPKGEWRLIDTLATYWSEHGEDRRSANTIFHQLAMLREGLGRNIRIGKLTNALLMDYRARRRGQGLQPHSVNREIELLEHFRVAPSHWF